MGTFPIAATPKPASYSLAEGNLHIRRLDTAATASRFCAVLYIRATTFSTAIGFQPIQACIALLGLANHLQKTQHLDAGVYIE